MILTAATSLRRVRATRRWLSKATVVFPALLLTGLCTQAPASAATALTNGHGTSICALSGSLTFSPPEMTGASGNSTISASFTSSSCGGNDFSQSTKTITGASATSAGVSRKVSTDCPTPAFAPNTNTAVSSFPKIRFKIAWTTATGKVPATAVTMLNGISTWTGADGPVASPTATQTLSFSGVASATGSFERPTTNLHAVKLALNVDQDFDSQVTNTTTGCDSPGGLAQIGFTGTLLIP